MADNLQITRVEKNRNGDGTSIYYTFAFPVTGDNLDGYVVLANGPYLDAMKKGTLEDPNAGLYIACMRALTADIAPYLVTTTASDSSTNVAVTKEA